MDGTGELFTEFAAALPKQFEPQIVRYPSEQCLSYAALEALVRSALPVSEPFLLVAESFSTPLAIQFAATRPRHLKGLILCSGFIASPIGGWRRLLAWRLAPLAFSIRLPELAIRRWFIGPDAPVSLSRMVRTAISSVHPDVLVARLRAVLACDVRIAASQIDAPVLYIQASQDRLVSTASFEEFHGVSPRVVLVALDGPHLILQRKPHEVAAIVTTFHQSLPTSRSDTT
jgi:pimeloyl-ACP methyl ester carboxylesterase